MVSLQVGLYLKQRKVEIGKETLVGTAPPLPSLSDGTLYGTPTVTGSWDLSNRTYINYTRVVNQTDGTFRIFESRAWNAHGLPFPMFNSYATINHRA